jgi:hypothetical protein
MIKKTSAPREKGVAAFPCYATAGTGQGPLYAFDLLELNAREPAQGAERGAVGVEYVT